MAKNRLILLGLDGLEPALFAPLLRAGLMPHLASLIKRGQHGPLTPILADCPPACWASLLTGQWPDTHGIMATQEMDSLNGGAKAVDSASLKMPALWHWLTAANLDSFRVGLPLSYPATELGICVSGAYPGEYKQDGRWATLPPSSLAGLNEAEAELLNALRVHPDDLDADAITPFIPDLAKIELSTDRRPAFVGVALARTLSLHNAATWLLEHQPNASGLIRYPLLDELSRLFLAYQPPQLATVNTTDYNCYQYIITGTYRLIDMLLGRIIELAGKNATLLISSNHGFRLEPEYRSSGLGLANHNPPTIRPEGWWLMAGNGLNAEAKPHRATVLDIAPTALTALGIAPPETWSGQTLWPAQTELKSYPLADINTVSANTVSTVNDNAKWLTQLAKIGLADPLAEPLAAQYAAAQAGTEWNRYRILMQRGEIEAAFACLNQLRLAGPMALLATLEQAGILGALARWQEASQLLKPLLSTLEQTHEQTLRQAGLPLQLLSVARYQAGIKAILARAQGDLAAARHHLDAVGVLPIEIACLHRLREELEQGVAA